MTSANAVPLTIAMPVLNGDATMRRALDTLLAQSFADFRLLIADNGSTDGTAAVCVEYARLDPRISFVRRPRTISAPDNFRLLAEAARTPYFMFAAADDRWLPGFIERNLAALREQPDAVLSCSRVEMCDADGRRSPATGTRALTGDAETRMRTYLRHAADNSRFYGIHRTALLQRGFAGLGAIVAYDWVALLPAILAGPTIELDDVLMVRDHTPLENYRDWVIRLEPGWLGRVVPHQRAARRWFALLPAELRWRLLPDILRMGAVSMINSPYPWARHAFAAAVTARQRLRRG